MPLSSPHLLYIMWSVQENWGNRRIFFILPPKLDIAPEKCHWLPTQCELKSPFFAQHFPWCLMCEPVVGKKRPWQSDILRQKSEHGPKHPHCHSGNCLQHAEHPPGSQQVYSRHSGLLWRGTCWQVTPSVILRCALLEVSQGGPQGQPQGIHRAADTFLF